MQPSLFDLDPLSQRQTRPARNKSKVFHATCEICDHKWILYPSTMGGMRPEAQALTMRVCKECRRPYRLQINRHRLSADAAVALMRCTVCSYCGLLLPRTFKRTVVEVDHDHRCCRGATSCGECVRGFVHKACNLRIGAFEAMADEWDVLRAYVDRRV